MAYASMLLVVALYITGSLAIEKGHSVQDTFAEVKSKQVLKLNDDQVIGNKLIDESEIEDELMDDPVEEMIEELQVELRDPTTGKINTDLSNDIKICSNQRYN